MPEPLTYILNLAHVRFVSFAAGALCILAAPLPFAPAAAESSFLNEANEAQAKIVQIDIFGNKRTRERFIRSVMQIDTGMTYDSATIAEATTRLRDTDLFTSADIFPQPRNDGNTRLLVVVVEKMYLTISDIGGELFEGKYGDDTTHLFAWRARLGVAHTNFRGLNENLSLHVTAWDWRAVSISWRKPFLNKPFFIRLGGSVGLAPDLYDPIDRFSVSAHIALGKNIQTNQRMYAGLYPSFNRYYRLDTDSTFEFYEAYSLIGYTLDQRNARFDTQNGTYFETSFGTNALYPRDPEYRYFLIGTESRLYHPGLREQDAVAYRIRMHIRSPNNDTLTRQYAGGFYAGGESTLRGYGLAYLPRGNYIANNRLLFTAEYRSPLVATPPMDFGVFTKLHQGLKGFYYRLDGALLFDAALLWNDFANPLGKAKDIAASAGLGIRIMGPTVKRGVSLDLSWPLIRPQEEWELIDQNLGWKRWLPVWHLYVDLLY